MNMLASKDEFEDEFEYFPMTSALYKSIGGVGGCMFCTIVIGIIEIPILVFRWPIFQLSGYDLHLVQLL